MKENGKRGEEEATMKENKSEPNLKKIKKKETEKQ